MEDKILGFSLLEMIFVCLMTSILVFVIFQMIVHDKKENQLQTALLEMNENALYAEKILTKEIMPAGFALCKNINTYSTIQYLDKSGFTPLMADNIFSVSLTGVITTRKVSSNFANVDMFSSEHDIIINSLLPSIKTNDWLLITDCDEAFVVKVRAVEKMQNMQVINLLSSVPLGLNSHALVGIIQEDQFYLARSHIKNTISLFQKDYQGKQMELLPDVMQWKVEAYSQGQWLNTEAIHAWQKVLALRVHLLLRSSQEVLQEPSAYFFDSKRYQAPDKYLYREFIIFIPLINKNE